VGAKIQAIRVVEREPAAFANVMIGVVVQFLPNGTLIVEVAGHSVRFTVGKTLTHLDAQISGLVIGSQVLITCQAGDPAMAILVGIVIDIGHPRHKALRAEVPVCPDMVQIDGKRVALDAKQELVLSCGKGSMSLTADGRIVIKGIEITTRALRKHKIKGGTVDIN
jgi:hypothetical protein